MFSDKLLDRVLQKKKNIDDASSFKRCVLLVSAITIHNIPEGIAIAVPIYYSTGSRGKAVINTLISGLSEPIGALLAYLFLYKYMSNFLISIILLFVAGIMISISINDIFDEARKYSNKYILIGFILGVIMIVVTQFVL